MTFLAVVLALVLGVACWRLFVLSRSHRRLQQERYGSVMMSALASLRTGEERRTYLSSAQHHGRVGRCDCAEYALPFSGTTLITEEITHTGALCQPNREVIEEPSS